VKFKQCPNAHLVLQDVNIEISSISILLSLSSQVIGKRRHVKVVVTKLSRCVRLNSVQQSNYHADYVMKNNYVFTVFSFFWQILYRNVVKKTSGNPHKLKLHAIKIHGEIADFMDLT